MVGNFLGGVAGGATVAVIIKAVDQYSKEFKKASTGINNFAGIAKGAGLAIAGIGVALTGVAVKSTRAAAKFQPLKSGFDKLTEGGDELLKTLNEVTKQTISNTDILLAANNALVLGIEENALPDLFEKTIVLGQAVGRTATQAINDITVGLGRQSIKILDNLGIKIQQAEIDEFLIQKELELGRALTESEKAAGFQDLTLKKLNDTYIQLGGELDQNFSVKMAQVRKVVDDLQVEFGLKLIPKIEEFFTLIAVNKDDIVEMATAIGDTLIGAVSLAINSFKAFRNFLLEIKFTITRAITELGLLIDLIKNIPELGIGTALNVFQLKAAAARQQSLENLAKIDAIGDVRKGTFGGGNVTNNITINESTSATETAREVVRLTSTT